MIPIHLDMIWFTYLKDFSECFVENSQKLVRNRTVGIKQEAPVISIRGGREKWWDWRFFLKIEQAGLTFQFYMDCKESEESSLFHFDLGNWKNSLLWGMWRNQGEMCWVGG